MNDSVRSRLPAGLRLSICAFTFVRGLPLIRSVGLAVAAWFGLTAVASAADPTVTLEKHGSEVEIKIGGRPFTTYHFDKSQAKPYFFPVLAEDGTSIVRPLANSTEEKEAKKPKSERVDHPHHKGIWFAIDEVNGNRFWAEKATIQNVSVELIDSGKNPAKLRAVNHWLGKDGKPVLIETTEVTIHGNRLMEFDFRLTAGEQKVTFDDTKEGLFGIRVADTICEKPKQKIVDRRAGGHIVNAEGKKGMAEAWGLESKWVDYFGPVNDKTYGVTVFDNPHNFRRSRHHVRDYGLYSVSPFGQSAYTNNKLPPDPFILESGKTARLRYGLFVHNGDQEQGKVAEAYQHYLQTSAD